MAVTGTGTPPTSPQVGAPRFSSADTATFPDQTNGITDAFDAYLKNLLSAGDLKVSAAATAPIGWLPCDGSAVSRTTYSALFSAIATTYGTGNGTTTFNVPDFRGRVIVGAGAGAGLTSRSRGDTGGAEAVALTDAAQNAPHSHTDTGHVHGWSGNGSAGGNPLGVSGASGVAIVPPAGGDTDVDYIDMDIAHVGIQSNGGGETHNNMQSFGVANMFIKT